jgi:hypothetical protein
MIEQLLSNTNEILRYATVPEFGALAEFGCPKTCRCVDVRPCVVDVDCSGRPRRRRHVGVWKVVRGVVGVSIGWLRYGLQLWPLTLFVRLASSTRARGLQFGHHLDSDWDSSSCIRRHVVTFDVYKELDSEFIRSSWLVHSKKNSSWLVSLGARA